jgi:hypothetical protein
MGVVAAVHNERVLVGEGEGRLSVYEDTIGEGRWEKLHGIEGSATAD